MRNSNTKIYVTMRALINLVFILLVSTSLFYCKTLVEIPQPIIKLSTNVPANSFANGKSSFRFVANVSASVSEDYSIVTFKATGGKFVDSDSTTVQMIRVNEKGEAVCDWIVPNIGGDYFVTASIGSGTTVYEDRVKVTLLNVVPDSIPVVPVVLDTILIAIPGFDSVRADSETLLRVDLALKLPSPKQLIVSNNAGTLSDGTAIGIASATKSSTVQLDQAGRGVAFLKLGNRVEPYFVRASVSGDPTAFKLFSFTPQRAYADNIFLEADSTLVQPNSQTLLTTFLTRNVGQVSFGTRVDYQAYQDFDGTKKDLSLLKNIANNTTNDLGRTFITFVADTSALDRTKPVIIRASTLNDRGQTIFKEVMLRVKDR